MTVSSATPTWCGCRLCAAFNKTAAHSGTSTSSGLTTEAFAALLFRQKLFMNNLPTCCARRDRAMRAAAASRVDRLQTWDTAASLRISTDAWRRDPLTFDPSPNKAGPSEGGRCGQDARCAKRPRRYAIRLTHRWRVWQKHTHRTECAQASGKELHYSRATSRQGGALTSALETRKCIDQNVKSDGRKPVRRDRRWYAVKIALEGDRVRHGSTAPSLRSTFPNGQSARPI
jgi:hypothetical protein